MPLTPDQEAAFDALVARTPDLDQVLTGLSEHSLWPPYLHTRAHIAHARLGPALLLRATLTAGGHRVGLCLLGPARNHHQPAGPQAAAQEGPAALWQMLARDDDEAAEAARQMLTEAAAASEVVRVCDQAPARREPDPASVVFEYLSAVRQAPWQGEHADFVLIGAPLQMVTESP